MINKTSFYILLIWIAVIAFLLGQISRTDGLLILILIQITYRKNE
nr:MAG TPA: hypothetical protein [Caudoviricetes sp.]